jgi:hypothetical protein
MPSFFIDRPIFAWVVAIFIMIAGAISLPLLPVSQYPNVAPPTLTVYTHYNGAPPEDIYESVTQLIEQQLNSVPNLLYYESTSDSPPIPPAWRASSSPSCPARTSTRQASIRRTPSTASKRGCRKRSPARACRFRSPARAS